MNQASFLLPLLVLLIITGCKPVYVIVNDPTLIEQEIEELDIGSLPFSVVYGGVQVRNADRLVGETGFTHVMLGSAPKKTRERIAPESRAVLWTGVAYGIKDSPWAKKKSPWGNNLNTFKLKWGRTLAGYAEQQGDLVEKPRADLIVLDIEANRTGRNILKLQEEETLLPEHLKSLSPSEFVAEYKRSMLSLSAEAVFFLKQDLTDVINRISSYGDVPIARNWYGIPKRTWQDWQTDQRLINYMGFEKGGEANPFADELNVITPSAYYFFPSGKNLAYMLFQIEANKAHSKKELILFITPRFVGKKAYGNPIGEKLAEATAIFPFFSGANGLWLWETSQDRKKIDDVEVLPAYQGFFRGLERLSEYHDFFAGKYQLHIPVSAHEAFSQEMPIWRGVVKSGKILVAAQNPYAKPGVETTLTIQYRGWKKDIVLQGKDTFLEHFKL